MTGRGLSAKRHAVYTRPMTENEAAVPEEFIGYAHAAAYLGLGPNTLNSYCSHGTGPRRDRDVRQGQYIRPVFKRADLDAWRVSRPGQGARTDRAGAEPAPVTA